MAIDTRPYREWLEAGSRLPHNAVRVSDSDWRRYWEVVSRNGQKSAPSADRLNENVVAYLKNTKRFMPGDTVLDVGCGPGAYSLLFSRDAKSVLGLDISDDILRLLLDEARKRNVRNVEVARSKWADLVPSRIHDLVFSSFCPAVNGPEALLKMEKHSRRSCCYVSSGNSRPPGLLYSLWEEMAGERFSGECYNVSYPLGLLRSYGRDPSVAYFDGGTGAGMPSRQIVDNFVAYFSMFMDVDPARRKFIGDFVESNSEGGQYYNKSVTTVGVVCWDIPG